MEAIIDIIKQDTFIVVWLVVTILLVIGFFIILGIDYSKYNDSQSAPFYITVITRGVEFIFPSVIRCCYASIIIRINCNSI